ncbi:thioesterase II family protein [Aquimarina hainanensis]|uniref:Thioesterase II family protein n=1 Tax=Aquimarina hainanensis TaxID=1578017 RepID=A0ABW5N9N6_9FLAO|nr:thioesterase [Aquimarina sp. TRL1]QKX03649.1 thioesterase [Aquimarina sp. TRL1]
MKIIALPFAGGNKYSFRKLEKHVPPSIQWITLELPGRGSRFKESRLEDISLMIEDLLRQIKPHIEESPYMIYGHSMGTLLGYELTKALMQLSYKLPECLFFTGRGAPNKVTFTKKSTLPKDVFWKEVEEMGGLPKELLEYEDLLDLNYPILKGDFKAIEDYVFTPMTSLFPMPLYVCMGEEEIGEGPGKTSIDCIKAWNEKTDAPQKIQWMHGDHFFILKNPKEIVDRIVNAFHEATGVIANF